MISGFKKEVSVLASNRASEASRHVPESIADIKIYFQHTNRYQSLLAEKSDEKDLINRDLFTAENYHSQAVLCDKCYQGLRKFVGKIHLRIKTNRNNTEFGRDRNEQYNI